MPTYEYRCPEGHDFEAFQKMSDPPVASCPECGRDGERRLSGGAGLLFKGSGFYTTDYRSESYKRAAASEADASGDKDAGGAKESSSKEAKKAPPGSGEASGADAG
ncbi:MAG: zinc ribbon domain-containing protein [Gemmatimonadota bacterium]